MKQDPWENIICRHVSSDTWKWLSDQAVLVREEQNAAELNKTFVLLPRKVGNEPLDEKGMNWTLDRLCRVWLLAQINPDDKTGYLKKIETLFSVAAMNELVALYSALPILAYPPDWRWRCAEGLRSNIGVVLEAILYENPYPHLYLEEGAWNQLVLKAFFTDKDIERIIGLEQRANRTLSLALLDYTRERRAAGRSIDPRIWALIHKFIDDVL